MKLEDQACSYSQARKIHKLGVENLSTLFVWGKGADDIYKLHLNVEWCGESEYCSFIPAYTVAELGVLLPGLIQTDEDDYFYYSEKTADDQHICGYCNPSTDSFLGRWQDEKDAKSKAGCFIWLLENNYLKASELKL